MRESVASENLYSCCWLCAREGLNRADVAAALQLADAGKREEPESLMGGGEDDLER